MPTAKPPKPAPPSAGTLAKYGLTVAEWLALVERCGRVCAVCGHPLAGRPLAIDHEHVKGWRAHKTRRGRKVRAMTPQERKRFVRGVVHAWCNRFVRKWLTLERGRAIVAYLEAYHERKELT